MDFFLQPLLSTTELLIPQLPELEPPPIAYGYICLTFGYEEAIRYFENVLKARYEDCFVISNDGDGQIRIQCSVPRPSGATAAQSSHIAGCTIDYDSRYTSDPQSRVLHQRIWRPQSDLDFHRHVLDATLGAPIFFVHYDGRVGVSIANALTGDFNSLCDTSVPINMGGKATTTLRINIPELPEYKCQIHIRDDTPNRSEISRGRLVRILGKQTAEYLNRVGSSWLSRETTVIVAVVQVSAGCWMPVLAQTELTVAFDTVL